ncbi:MAG: hypothetical protein ACFE0J_05200 [Elainellaceae cyanobacterium]
MTQYVYSGRSRPCPICDRTKDPDCRWNEEVVFCHTYIDQDASIEGYVYRGATADGLWGQYFKLTQSEKSARPQQRQDFFYPTRQGQPLVKVTRVDRGSGTKFFVQYHWDGQRWVKGLTPAVRKQVPIYRYAEVRRAMAAGQSIWMVEGEGCADVLWNVGIPATTTLGGSKKYHSYGDYPKTWKGLAWCCAPIATRSAWLTWKRLPRIFRTLSGAIPIRRVCAGKTCLSMAALMLRTGLPRAQQLSRFEQPWENGDSWDRLPQSWLNHWTCPP